MFRQATPLELSEKSDCKKWDHDATRSQRVACAALMGVYGMEAEQDLELIRRGLSDELTQDEINTLEQKRPEGYEYRFGPSGRFEIPS